LPPRSLVADLVDRVEKLTQTDVAKAIGKSQPWVSTLLSWAARPNKEEPEPGELSALLIIDPVERDTPFTGRSSSVKDEIIQVMKDDGIEFAEPQKIEQQVAKESKRMRRHNESSRSVADLCPSEEAMGSCAGAR
jgi:predicted transcriptional regulator